MIELEIQTLSESREGLLADVGGAAVASGFSLVRQRIVQDPHGVLLTMVVRGHPRGQRALRSALDANERLISYELSPFEAGSTRPHFAASRTFARPPLPPRPEPESATPIDTRQPPAPASARPTVDAPVESEIADTLDPLPQEHVRRRAAPETEPEPDFILPSPPAQPAEPAQDAVEPYVEVVVLEADTDAIDIAWPQLTQSYPHVLRRLQALGDAVAVGARASSLHETGRRLGAWLSRRNHASGGPHTLADAIERIALPALLDLVQVEHKGGHLHIHDSPLCRPDGHSGCSFFGGYLEGLLGPALASEQVSAFSLCCRSCGADACVLAISD